MIGTLNRLFRPAMVRSARRAFSTNGVTALTSNHFFVDSNVIIGHHLEQYEGLKAFVADTDRHFYYTETVLEELQAASEKLRVPEADPDSPNSNFR
ncbi:MAG: hypothetical protein K0U23_08980, partial [Gammaproteobacteria bacterium]|nr:hypothetical protein [Gammaproteobacteria bacterium]